MSLADRRLCHTLTAEHGTDGRFGWQSATEPAEIKLFTRPRRFGKTLVMSMLASFFDIRRDSKDLFEGLKIAEDQKLCELWMNQ